VTISVSVDMVAQRRVAYLYLAQWLKPAAQGEKARMAKSEKLFEILNLISESPDLTPKDLALLCDVSERAIYRYMNTLSKVGFSIRFQNGGYKLQGAYDNLFSKAEPESLKALKLLISAGMRSYGDDKILEYGRKFIELIEMNLPEPEKRQLNEIEIIPEEVRADQHGGTLLIGHSSVPDIINPILTSETISVNLMNLIFSSLVRFDAAQRPVPDLAKSWEVSKDGLVWTFFVREDVSFHDGHPLTANDVEFTYRSVMDPENVSPVTKRYELIGKIETEGDYIFRVTLKHPFMPFIHWLSREIAPKHLLENVDLHSTSFNRHPIGSGPFKLVDWMDNNTIILDANKEYFRKDRPILDRLVFRTYTDRGAALQAIGQGEMDIALNLAASDLSFLSRSGTFRTYSASAAFYYALILNMESPIFKDIRVRKALDYAMDRESIIRNQLKGHGRICTGPFSINSWAYNPDVKSTPHNVEKAKDLLAQAGWQDTDGDGILDKDGKPFEISLTIPNISDVIERIAVAIKVQLVKIGIRVKPLYIDDSKLYTTPYQTILAMMIPGPDPEYARISWHSESGNTNMASYKNNFVDNLMDQGRQIADIESRKEIYHKIHEMIHDDCPAIFLASAFEYIGSKYQFKDDEFPSVTHFLSSMRDWQIADEERREQKKDTAYEYQEKMSAL